MKYPPDKPTIFLLLIEDFEHSRTEIRAFSQFSNAYTEFCKMKDAELDIIGEGKDFYQLEDLDYEEMISYQVSIKEIVIEDDSIFEDEDD